MPTFRFLHASDFHLERPPGGLTEAPDHLRDLLIEAPYRAANNVFDAALNREVDFVVLAGDLVAPERSGPRGVLFLREQFARLAKREIPVYWAGGPAELVHRWPAAIAWPSNVHIAPNEQPVCFAVRGQGQLLCEIVAQGHSSYQALNVPAFTGAMSSDGERKFVIGLSHGELADELPGTMHVDYWALGGQHELTLPQETRPLVHYPGTPQARAPDETGPHGCTLVEVGDDGDIRTVPVVTDVVRYCQERIAVAANAPASELERLLRERMQSLADSNPQVALIANFTVDEDGGMPAQGQMQRSLPATIGILRGEFGYRSPPVWLDRVRWPAAEVPDSWRQQENLLGDLLRAAGYLAQTGHSIDLDRYLPREQWREPVAAMLRYREPAVVQNSLREAATLAAGLLYPEEAHR
jgi:hypothetical protein